MKAFSLWKKIEYKIVAEMQRTRNSVEKSKTHVEVTMKTEDTCEKKSKENIIPCNAKIIARVIVASLVH